MLRYGKHFVPGGCRSWTSTALSCNRFPSILEGGLRSQSTGKFRWPAARFLSLPGLQPRLQSSIALPSTTGVCRGQDLIAKHGIVSTRNSNVVGLKRCTQGSRWSNADLLIMARPLQTSASNGSTSPGTLKNGGRLSLNKDVEKPTLKNRYILPPEDGLTRYPTLSSPQGILRGMDYMGTMVFALSGTVTAGQSGMDLLGCVIVGTITATGGGTVRDLLIGNNPVFWMEETEYLWMCLATTVGVFFLWSYLAEQGVRDDMALLNWADAMGIGAFCCIGAQAGIRKGLPMIVCVACGMVTSTFGGVIRDVLCSRPPRILFSHAEIYASTALFGSTLYVLSRAGGLPPVARILLGFVGGAGFRVLAFTTDIRLPSWSQPSSAALEGGLDGQIEGEEEK